MATIKAVEGSQMAGQHCHSNRPRAPPQPCGKKQGWPTALSSCPKCTNVWGIQGLEFVQAAAYAGRNSLQRD
eukprot:95070-Amphidinium_carterae.1